MNHCKGCRSYASPGHLPCTWKTYNESGKCPCSLCIIKGMCNDSCDPYEVWKVWVSGTEDMGLIPDPFPAGIIKK